MGSILSTSNSNKFSLAKCNDSFFSEPEFDQSISPNNAQLILDTKKFVEKNPGGFDDLLKQIKENSPNSFEGVKLVANLPIGENLLSSLNWQFASPMHTKFYPSFNFVGDKQIRSFERTPMGLLEFDNSKNFGFSVLHYLNKRFRVKLLLQSKGAMIESSEYNALYYGDSFTTSVSVVNPTFSSKSAILVGHILKRITGTLDLGCEFVAQTLNGSLAETIPTFALRYSHGINPDQIKDSNGLLPSLNIEPKGTFLVLLSTKTIHLSYQRHAGPGLQLISTCDLSPSAQVPNLSSMGYLYKIPKIDLTVKSAIDTSQTVQAVIEKQFNQGNDAWSLSVCLAHNFPSNRTITGIGLTLGK